MLFDFMSKFSSKDRRMGIMDMHGLVGVLVVLFTSLINISQVQAQTNSETKIPAELSWAFLWDTAAHNSPPDTKPVQLTGSKLSYSQQQTRDMFFAASWFPDQLPTMPEVVAHGRRPDVRACGGCHRADGSGGPDSASLAGLPAAYIVQQMADLKSGARQSALLSRPPEHLMTVAAQAATDTEIQDAANYFAGLKARSVVRVVESKTAPLTTVVRYFYARQGEGNESLGQRIVEVPDDLERYELHDSRVTFTAYVPVGSLQKGRALTESKSNPSVACAGCHGADLRGLGAVPSIAGRSPSYLARQLYAFKIGVRNGAGAVLMKPVAERFTENDIVAVVAYLASLTP